MIKKLSAILLSLLLCTSVYAQPGLVVIDEHKGLQRNPKADKIQDGAHERFTNVYIDDGNITSVKGRERLNATANADTVVNMMCYYENAAGTTKKLVIKESDEIVTYDTDGTGRTQIAATLTNEKADCVQIGDSMYFNSSTDGLRVWTGSGSATALAGVSAPSSIDFSAASNAGGMTPGEDAVVLPKYSSNNNYWRGTSGTGACTQHFSNATCDEAIYENTTCGNNANCLETCATSSVYQYKITKRSALYGIESEPSTADSATLEGANTITCAGVGPFPTFSDSSCTNSGVTRYTDRNCISTGAKTSTSATSAAAPGDPFDEYCYYRTTAGGEDYFLAFCSNEFSASITDGKPDAALSTPLDTTIDTISPPSFRYIENYKGTIFTAEGNDLRFTRIPVSAVTSADTYWLETDQLEISSEYGTVTGLHKTSDSMIIFTGKSVQELTGFGVTSFRLRTMVTGVGSVSDETIETDSQGDLIFFAGSQGVYKLRTFQQPQDQLTGNAIDAPRVTVQKLSGPVLDDVFLGDDSEIDLDPATYSAAHAYYDLDNDLYFLYVGNHSFVFDNRNAQWSYIPATDMDGSVYRRSTNEKGQGVLLDNSGFFYNNWKGYANGVASGTVTGNSTSSTSNTLTDSGASFNVTGSGLAGAWIYIDNENQEYHQIASNTATAITISDTWTTNPITSDDYYIGYIIPDWKTKQYSLDKAPRETNVMNFWIVVNKADSAQDVEFYTYENKSATPSRQLSSVIDVSSKFIHKLGSKLRSSWVQWGFRTFIYNTSDTISKPLDVVSYAIEAEVEEEK